MGPRLPAGRPGDEREEKVEDAVTAHPGGLPAAFGVAFWWSVAFSLLAVLLSLWLPGAPRDRDRREPAEASPVPAAAGSGKIDL